MSPPQTADQHDELLHLAKALDGIAGALHEGHVVPRTDLDSAGKAAHALWRAEGVAPQAQEFEMYRVALLENAAGAARGDQRVMSLVGRAAHRLAKGLRARADTAGRTLRAHPELDPMIDALDKRYARFAAHPVALPM
jgi:hypothetical protein